MVMIGPATMSAAMEPEMRSSRTGKVISLAVMGLTMILVATWLAMRFGG